MHSCWKKMICEKTTQKTLDDRKAKANTDAKQIGELIKAKKDDRS